MISYPFNKMGFFVCFFARFVVVFFKAAVLFFLMCECTLESLAGLRFEGVQMIHKLLEDGNQLEDYQ